MEQKPQSRCFGLTQLFSLIVPYRLTFVFGLIALGAGSAINLYFPELIRRALNPGGMQSVTEHPVLIALGFVLLFAIQSFAFYFRSYCFGAIGQQAVRDLRERFSATLMQKPLAFLDLQEKADLTTRFSNDCALLQDAVSTKLSVLVRYGFQVVVGILLMFLLSPKLSLILVCGIPLLVCAGLIQGRRLKHFSTQFQQGVSYSTQLLDQTLGSIRMVRAFGRESYQLKRLEKALQQTLNTGMQRVKASAFLSSFVSFLLYSFLAAVLVYGMHLVLRGQMTAGDLTAFLLYGLIVGVSFALLSNTYFEDITRSLGAGERIFQILNSQKKTTQTETGSVFPKTFRSICFSKVYFRYPSRPSSPVLEDFNCKIPSEKITAFTGKSGIGKSTAFQLMLGLYQPDSGSILIDETNLGSFSKESLRQAIGYVPQEPQLFHLSIRENIQFGNPDASEEEIVEACRKANILDFIRNLPDGFDTKIGDQGVTLSIGQRQRIAIARALVRNPRILLLDEASASLDSDTEMKIYSELFQNISEQTIVFISHREAPLKFADEVVNLQKEPGKKAAGH